MGTFRKVGKQRSECLFSASTWSLWKAVRSKCFILCVLGVEGRQGEGMDFLVHGLYFGLVWVLLLL